MFRLVVYLQGKNSIEGAWNLVIEPWLLSRATIVIILWNYGVIWLFVVKTGIPFIDRNKLDCFEVVQINYANNYGVYTIIPPQ